MVLAPVVRDRKGEFVELFQDMQAQGYVRFRIGSNGQPGQVFEAGELPRLKKNEKHDIDVVVDRLRVQPGLKQRLAESFETALRIADGRAIALQMDDADTRPQPPREHLFSSSPVARCAATRSASWSRGCSPSIRPSAPAPAAAAWAR